MWVVCIEAAGQDHPGRQAYMEAGCAGCHGPGARGGVDGPAMVPREDTVSEFAASFQEMMPGFEATDEELSSIHAYLRDLTDPSTKVDAAPPAGSEKSWEPGNQADAEAIRDGAARFVAAWNARDAKALSELFTKDAERIGPDGEPVIGRAAIEKQLAESFVDRPVSDVVTVSLESIHFLTPDVAVTHGSWRIGGGLHGKYMNLTIRQGDRWLVSRSMVMQPVEP